MNRRIQYLAGGLIVCFLALFAQLNRVQVFDAAQLNHRSDNTRIVERDFNRPRGNILTADGTVIATSEATKGERFAYQRTYPTGDLFAHVTGSYSYAFGADGVERTYNDELTGQTTALKLKGYANPLVDRSSVGNVVLTLRASVQTAARDALGDKVGSVVAINPQTGGVLAMYSNPTYDPNTTSNNDTVAARAARELLDAASNKPRLARTYREIFFPGSTFKVVTAAAGVGSGKVTADSPSYPRTRTYTPPGTSRPLRNFDGATCGGTLNEILRVSCNTAFAEMGAETLGPDLLIDAAKKFGFNDTPPIDLPGAEASKFPTDFGKRLKAGADAGDADVYENTPKLAQTAIGQNDVQATPLQMALVAAAIAHGGTVMTPHVMDHVEDVDAATVDTYEAKVWKRATDEATAATVKAAMIEVAEKGTATAIRIAGVQIGAKTGTAQLGTTPPKSHAWVIAFAGPPNVAPTVAVAVLVEGQSGTSEQTGGRVAAPIARAVIQAALAAN